MDGFCQENDGKADICSRKKEEIELHHDVVSKIVAPVASTKILIP
jgi:hypothetical protein